MSEIFSWVVVVGLFWGSVYFTIHSKICEFFMKPIIATLARSKVSAPIRFGNRAWWAFNFYHVLYCPFCFCVWGCLIMAVVSLQWIFLVCACTSGLIAKQFNLTTKP